MCRRRGSSVFVRMASSLLLLDMLRFARFGVGQMLEAPDDLLKITEMLTSAVPPGGLRDADATIDPEELEEIMCRPATPLCDNHQNRIVVVSPEGAEPHLSIARQLIRARPRLQLSSQEANSAAG